MISARDAVAGQLYAVTHRTPVRTRYTLAAAGTAKRLVARLAPLAARHQIRGDQLEELRAARAALAGDALLFVREMQGLSRQYVAIPAWYRLRPVKR